MIMNRSNRTIAVAAFLALAACNNQPETITGGVADPQQKELAEARPVELPPAISASRTYRCKDNSLVYIDFYTNNTATVRKQKSGDAVTLAAAEAGKPYTADGYSVSANSSQISYTAPGRGTQSCKA
jgi:hypothetical protein